MFGLLTTTYNTGMVRFFVEHAEMVGVGVTILFSKILWYQEWWVVFLFSEIIVGVMKIVELADFTSMYCFDCFRMAIVYITGEWFYQRYKVDSS